MFYVAICDDFIPDKELLKGYVQELAMQGTAIRCSSFDNGEELLNAYHKGERFDVVILDLLETQLLGATDVIEAVRRYDSEVTIILTSIAVSFAHMRQAVHFSVLRYTNKYTDKKCFQRSILEVLRSKRSKQQENFTFHNKSGLNKVKLSDIKYFESDIKTVHICEESREYSFNESISSIDERIPKDSFCRIHKSYIVNFKYVKRIIQKSIILDNDIELPMSRRRGKDVRARFNAYASSSNV